MRTVPRPFRHTPVRVAALAAAALLLAACGGETSGEPSASGDAGGKLKVAVLTSGTAQDGSWGQAVTEGAKAAAGKFGAEVQVSDNLDTPQQFQQLGSAFAQQGYDLVVVANGAAADAVKQLAKQFPDVKFGGIAQEIPDIPANVRTVTPIFQETSFLAGVLAGTMTKTDTVATIGGFDFPVLNNEMEGFALGARYANADVKVLRSFINSWTDAGKGRAAAEAAVSQGADFIFSATDQATQGMAQVTQDKADHYVITQYADDHKQAPKTILTSALYGLGEITGQFVEDVAGGGWKNENVQLGLKDIGGLAPFYELESKVPQAAKAAVTQAEEAMKKGCLTLPDGAALGKSGSADAVDVTPLQEAVKSC
ncbi:BMP family protein [Microbispora sp. H13382]|uniref:BMP family lipoprotein n=1 Tax=Microbispora sp. H13382 TaxID=2729112 RepID=UPI0016021BA1|nr:BMP family protein [Microbispora sp. H13382]